VVDLALAADAGVEHLRALAISVQGVRIEQVSASGRERQSALAIAQINRLDEPLIAEVLKGVVRKIELAFRHDAKHANGGQSTAVFAVQFVDSIAINDQFALVAARQIEITHQAITRILVVALARVVHALPLITAIPRVVLARIIPSSIGHPSLRCLRVAVLGCP